MTMERVQMLLEPRQRCRLAENARAQGESVAEITRLAIDAGLVKLSEDDRSSRLLAALDEVEYFRNSLPLLDIDLVRDIRQLRDEGDDELLDGRY